MTISYASHRVVSDAIPVQIHVTFNDQFKNALNSDSSSQFACISITHQ